MTGRAMVRRRSASNGRGRTSTPGLSRSRGSRTALTAAMAAMASGEYISGSTSDRARPSPCSPDIDPLAPGDQPGRLLDERPVDAAWPPGPVEGEVDAHVQAAVAEVAVGDAAEPVVGEQGLEVAQVDAQPFGRDGRVLPAGPGRRPGRAAAAEPGPVLADAPDGGRLGRGAQDPGGQRIAGHGGGEPGRGRLGLGLGRAGQLHQQPAAAPGEVGHRPPPAPDHLDDAGVDPLKSHRPVRQDDADGVGRGSHVRVAEHDQRGRRRRPDEPERGLQDHGQGALAADQSPWPGSPPRSGSRCSSA